MINTCTIKKHVAIANLARHFCTLVVEKGKSSANGFSCKKIIKNFVGKGTITILQERIDCNLLCRICFCLGMQRWLRQFQSVRTTLYMQCKKNISI